MPKRRALGFLSVGWARGPSGEKLCLPSLALQGAGIQSPGVLKTLRVGAQPSQFFSEVHLDAYSACAVLGLCPQGVSGSLWGCNAHGRDHSGQCKMASNSSTLDHIRLLLFVLWTFPMYTSNRICDTQGFGLCLDPRNIC